MTSSPVRVVLFVVFSGAIFYLGRLTAPSAKHAVETSLSPAKPGAEVKSASNGVEKKESATPSKDQVQTWKQRLGQMVACPGRDEEELRMISAWAQVDPMAALEYARKSLSHDFQAQALTAVFTSWAKKDPNAAWSWVVTNEPTNSADLRSVLAETAGTNPVLAQQFAAQYATAHPEASAEIYFAALDGVFHVGNYEAAKAMIAQAQMPNDEQKNSLINLLAGQWARYQPENAAAWVLALPAGPVRDQAVDALGQAWSDINPVQAADFAVKLPPGAERQTALRQAISKWTLDDPAQASNWVLQFDAHQDFDQAVASIATSYNVMNRNINLALSWAGTIQDETLRNQSTTAIVSNWYANDASSALNYIKTSPDLTPAARQQLLQAVVPKEVAPAAKTP